MENNQLHSENENQDYLSTEADLLFQYDYATTGQRFLNFFIDNLFMRFALGYLIGMGVGTILARLFPEFMYKAIYGDNKEAIYVIAYLVAIIDYVFYYTLCEKLFKGYTLGKLITGTRAIRHDGADLTFKDAMLRSLCRIVPFEPFSAFGGHPWHDRWTETIVIKSR